MREHPDGVALLKAYNAASGPSAKIEDRPRPNPRSTPTLVAVDKLAEQLVADGKCENILKARARVWETHPQLVKKYDSERAAEIKKQQRR